jgi:1-pyrroline-5-carboxylate dehydrogenase
METDVKTTQMKITYSTMSAEQMFDLHAALDKAIADVKQQFGQTHPMFINGQPVTAGKTFEDESPIDTRWILGRFQSGGRDHVKDAVAAARAAAPAWAALPWRERVAKVRAVADAIRNHRWELSAIMGYEAGKNRLECVGDVEESADLMSYYCDQVEAHNGFEQSMATLGPNERNSSVLRP